MRIGVNSYTHSKCPAALTFDRAINSWFFFRFSQPPKQLFYFYIPFPLAYEVEQSGWRGAAERLLDEFILRSRAPLLQRLDAMVQNV